MPFNCRGRGTSFRRSTIAGVRGLRSSHQDTSNPSTLFFASILLPAALTAFAFTKHEGCDDTVKANTLSMSGQIWLSS